MPVITALGHTSDRTLADLVADREARTPTAAAEIVVPKKADLLRQLGERGQRLQRAGLTALNAPRPGTTAFDAAEAGPGPAELLPAVTVKVYAVASVRPGTLAHR